MFFQKQKRKLFIYLQDFTSLFDFDFREDFFFELLFVPPIVGDVISSSISSGD
jgi:hypothetical protein